ncbi:hypothetical protein [Mesorhizobium sp. WSM3873]|uniref:hypothetical protein n=1 Tax=Mesorhizobium sp. WSM3873 TaxID=1854056 RepID=UPI00082F59CB|nr:hypothetical protein [Mesorhizobium sp. WSM3873]
MKSSQFFNNQAFAQAANNLASLFEPPSGADAAGWALANERKAAAQRLADFYDYRNNPNFDQQMFDRMGVAAGAYQPNQSYYSVDQTNATSRANNAADNERAIQTNAADNARALEVGQISGLADLYKPVGEGEVRPAIPQDVAGRFGVTRELPAEQGRVKPITDDQLKAAILSKMPQNVQEAAAFGGTPIEAIVTPEGPRNVTRLDAIGQTPYETLKGGLTVTTNPDGTTTVTQGGSGSKITEFQGKQNAYATRMGGALPIIDQLGGELTDFSQAAYDALPTVGTIKTGNGMLSENYQKASNAGRLFLQSVLRLDSGAAIPPAEEAQYGDVFLPRPGDKPGTLKQKRLARNLAFQGVQSGMTPDQILATGRAVLAAQNAVPGATTAPPATTAPTSGVIKFQRGADGRPVRAQ